MLHQTCRLLQDYCSMQLIVFYCIWKQILRHHMLVNDNRFHYIVTTTIIITTCYGATQPVLSSALKQHSVYIIQYSLHVNQVKWTSEISVGDENIVWINVPHTSRKRVPRSFTFLLSKWSVSKTCLCPSHNVVTTCWWSETVVVVATAQVGQNLNIIFNSLILSRLQYALPDWSGFLSADLHEQ